MRASAHRFHPGSAQRVIIIGVQFDAATRNTIETGNPVGSEANDPLPLFQGDFSKRFGIHKGVLCW